MKKLLIIAVFFASCTKQEFCRISTFSSVQCEPGRVDVITRRLTDTPMDPETCKSMRDKMIQDRKDDGTFYWKGHPIELEELIYCECQ